MANQTVTDLTVNHDSASVLGLLNNETYTLNNSNIVFNADTRWGQNAAIPGSITISSTQGGKVTVDGTTIWQLPYTSATGNVPTLTTLGSNPVTGVTSGATGEFFAVFSNVALDPIAATTAMPATGWIKLRSKTGNFTTGETVNLPGGATIVIANAGRRSWVHMVCGEAANHIVPRLGKFEVLGDWFELGTTNGADDQTFQFPVADHCPAIWVETAASSGVYEKWLNASSVRWGQTTAWVPTDVRGKYFGMVDSTGIITIARRASNTSGFKPPTGCRVRIPNVIMSSSATPFTTNSVNATLASRPEFLTTSGGDISIDKASCNWYLNFSGAFRINITNTSTADSIAISTTASDTTLNNVAVGLSGSVASGPIITCSNLFTNLTMIDFRGVRREIISATQNATTLTDVANITMTDVQLETFGSATAATLTRGGSGANVLALTRCFDGVITRLSAIGASITISTCGNLVCSDTRYADLLAAVTSTTNAVSGMLINGASIDITVDGFSNFGSLANVHPSSSLITIGSGSRRIKIQNIGTAAAPYNLGTVAPTPTLVTATVAQDLTFRRIYTINQLAGTPLTLSNTVQNVTIENVWTNETNTAAVAAVNVLSRGNRWTNSTTAQTASYGRHWEDYFVSSTRGFIMIAANEPLAATVAQCSTSGLGAESGFTSAGNLALPTANDFIVWEMPYFLRGHTKLGGSPILNATGTLVENMNYDYQIDTGSGFGSWKFLFGSRLRSAGGTAGTNSITLAAKAGIRQPAIGDYIGTALGTNFATGTTITNVVGDVLTLSSNILVSISTSVNVFYWRNIEDEASFSASTGVKLKVRATAIVANNTNAINYIFIPTVTDATSRQTPYPLPGIPVTLTNLQPNSEVRVYAGTDPASYTVIAGVEDITGSYIFEHNNAGQAGVIVVYALGYNPIRLDTTFSSSPVEINIQQQIDRVYTNPL